MREKGQRGNALSERGSSNKLLREIRESGKSFRGKGSNVIGCNKKELRGICWREKGRNEKKEKNKIDNRDSVKKGKGQEALVMTTMVTHKTTQISRFRHTLFMKLVREKEEPELQQWVDLLFLSTLLEID